MGKRLLSKRRQIWGADHLPVYTYTVRSRTESSPIRADMDTRLPNQDCLYWN